jgi:hypothetical protein
MSQPGYSEHTEPISLEQLNEFLAAQKGHCIRCGKTFEHCGGDKQHEVAIPCRCCFNRMDGLICVNCAVFTSQTCFEKPYGADRL